MPKRAKTAKREEPASPAGGLEEKIRDLEARLLRTAADFDNFRKRVESERELMGKMANAELLLKVIPVLDNFQRAFQHIPKEEAESDWVQGARHIEKQLEQVLEEEGLERIPTVGQQFNPQFHEAVDYENQKELSDHVIIKEHETGWKIGDRVIKPAKVTVNKLGT